MCQHGWLPSQIFSMSVSDFRFAVEQTDKWNRALNAAHGGADEE